MGISFNPIQLAQGFYDNLVLTLPSSQEQDLLDTIDFLAAARAEASEAAVLPSPVGASAIIVFLFSNAKKASAMNCPC